MYVNSSHTIMPHYQKPHLTVRYDEEMDAVMMEWDGFVQGDPFREGLEAGLELVQERQAGKWFADLRALGTIDQADQEWSNEEWFPRAMETSLSRMAIIKPESTIANMSVENIMQEVGDGAMTTKYFDNRAEAKAWL
jgi:hypothetical protein